VKSNHTKSEKERRGIDRVAVIGAGLMGHGIAQVFAEHGCSVVLYDVADGLLSRALDRIRSNLALTVALGMDNQESADRIVSRIRTTTDLIDAVKAAQFVTEAAPEDLGLKREIFKRIEAGTGDQTILASNTSTLSITEIGKSIEKGDRLIVTHWFNPPHLVPAVEVAKGERTSEDVFKKTFLFLEEMDKIPVHVLRQVPGFLVNRIQTAMFREVVALLEEGVASAEDIDKAVRGSFALRLAIMGPLAVVDFGGVDLWYKGAQNLYPSLDASKEPRKLWTEMVDRGYLGEKTGRGFFEYDPLTAPAVIKDRDIKLLSMLHTLYPRKRKGD
jgi:3-hydroxybutyryl-CoA dehydrogenase